MPMAQYPKPNAKKFFSSFCSRSSSCSSREEEEEEREGKDLQRRRRREREEKEEKEEEETVGRVVDCGCTGGAVFCVDVFCLFFNQN